MTFIARSCVTLLALCICLGSVAQGGTFGKLSPENPAHPGKCYDERLKQAVAVGASITDHSDCTRLRCSKSKAKPPVFMLQGETCSYATGWPANCQVVNGNPAADFPDCCSKLECDGPPQGGIKGVGRR